MASAGMWLPTQCAALRWPRRFATTQNFSDERRSGNAHEEREPSSATVPLASYPRQLPETRSKWHRTPKQCKETPPVHQQCTNQVGLAANRCKRIANGGDCHPPHKHTDTHNESEQLSAPHGPPDNRYYCEGETSAAARHTNNKPIAPKGTNANTNAPYPKRVAKPHS